MRRAAHNGCCRRVAQTRALFSVLWKLLTSEKLMEALMTIETPLVRILTPSTLFLYLYICIFVFIYVLIESQLGTTAPFFPS